MRFKNLKLLLIFILLPKNGFGVDQSLEWLVEVIPEHQKCSNDKDCARFSLKCSCDCGFPINSSFLPRYLEIKEKECKGYTGPYCKMECPEEVKCSIGKCVVVEMGL